MISSGCGGEGGVAGRDSLLCQGRTSGLPSHSAASRSTSPWREVGRGRGREEGGEEERLRRRPGIGLH